MSDPATVGGMALAKAFFEALLKCLRLSKWQVVVALLTVIIGLLLCPDNDYKQLTPLGFAVFTILFVVIVIFITPAVELFLNEWKQYRRKVNVLKVLTPSQAMILHAFFTNIPEGELCCLTATLSINISDNNFKKRKAAIEHLENDGILAFSNPNWVLEQGSRVFNLELDASYAKFISKNREILQKIMASNSEN